ncbi:alpha/beta fold hydrolase [Streptomyces sp. NPDC051677]|uniref:alpha/beta fold hydrolase n=1 Tax=Streptomyces sp. NPDC051677 TaxID=3365669 RepID=UPI0037D84072
MTIVFVHGNPETDAVWDPLRAELGRSDVVALSPPGFGAPVPTGFGATMTEYRDWLISRLVEIGEPVDLVGHDWGGGHVLNVAMARPDLLRSWASDTIGTFHPDYVWHGLAQVWQTPGAGEEFVETLTGDTVEDRTEQLRRMGIPDGTAVKLAEGQTSELGWCILALYRSAAQPALAQAGESLSTAAARPGLAISPTEDPFLGSLQSRREAAEKAGARVVELEGLAHWWMLQDPVRSAAILTEFWSSLPT